MGSATVSFGLVAIPVKMYSTGDSSEAVRFNMMHRTCGTRLQYRYYCPTDETFVERDEIAKGYEFAKGQFVLFSDEELKALNPEPTNAIAITEFVPLTEVDPIYYEKSYYLGPDKGGGKPYRLLADAMRESGQAAIARYAARGKDYLVLLRPFAEGLILQQLRYPDEIRAFSEVPLGEGQVKKNELDLALRLIEQIAEDEFHPERYEDEQRKRTWELIQRKVEGEEIVAPPEEAPKAQIIDLMAALKASLGETEDAKPAKRSSRKPRGAATAEVEEAPGAKKKASGGGRRKAS